MLVSCTSIGEILIHFLWIFSLLFTVIWMSVVSFSSLNTPDLCSHSLSKNHPIPVFVSLLCIFTSSSVFPCGWVSRTDTICKMRLHRLYRGVMTFCFLCSFIITSIFLFAFLTATETSAHRKLSTVTPRSLSRVEQSQYRAHCVCIVRAFYAFVHHFPLYQYEISFSFYCTLRIRNIFLQLFATGFTLTFFSFIFVNELCHCTIRSIIQVTSTSITTQILVRPSW